MAAPAFTSKTLSFLRALKRNNSREWFHARRDDYEAHVRGPMVAIVERLAEDFRTVAPEFSADPKTSIFRQWRDTRFSENKTPLKTQRRRDVPQPHARPDERRRPLLRGRADVGLDRRRHLRTGRPAAARHPAPSVRSARGVPAPSCARRRSRSLAASKASVSAACRAGSTRIIRRPICSSRSSSSARAKKRRSLRRSPTFYKELLATFAALVPLCRFLNEPLVARRQARSVALCRIAR